MRHCITMTHIVFLKSTPVVCIDPERSHESPQRASASYGIEVVSPIHMEHGVDLIIHFVPHIIGKILIMRGGYCQLCAGFVKMFK